MPVPMMAPIPSATRWGQERVAFSRWAPSRGAAVTGLRRVTKLMDLSPRSGGTMARVAGPRQALLSPPGVGALAPRKACASLAVVQGAAMRRLLIAFVLALFAAPVAAGLARADDAPLNRLVADYEAYALSQSPIQAGREGDRAALSRLPDVTPAASARRKAAYQAFQARLAAIAPGGLSEEARLNRSFLAWTL